MKHSAVQYYSFQSSIKLIDLLVFVNQDLYIAASVVLLPLPSLLVPHVPPEAFKEKRLKVRDLSPPLYA